MNFAGATLLEIELEHPSAEAEFMHWWDEAVRFLEERARLRRADLLVLARGRYLAVLGFALPGVWKIVERDRQWKELERLRPLARVAARQARPWHREGNPRDLTTAELIGWLEERRAGRHDFVLVDTLPRSSYEEHHIPGAVNLPLDELDVASAEAIIGPDRDRTVVVYCSGYG